jgi:hypothetical protein
MWGHGKRCYTLCQDVRIEILRRQRNRVMVMQTDNGHSRHGHSRDGIFTHSAQHPYDSTLLKRVEGMKQADLLYLLRLLDRKRQKVKRLDAMRRLGKPRLYALSFDAQLAHALMVALVTYHGLDLPEASLEEAEFAAVTALDLAFYDKAYQQALQRAADRVMRVPKDLWLLNANPAMPSYDVDAQIVADIANALPANELQRVIAELNKMVV